MKKLFLVACAFTALICPAAPAAAQTLIATGQGWCSTSGCNNSLNAGATVNYNNLTLNNWFTFAIPNVTITSATLSVFNDEQNYNLGAGTYGLYAASGLTYSGLEADFLQSIGLTAANEGASRYIDFELTPYALQLLNQSAGGSFMFGGSVDGTTSESIIFGFTFGGPLAQLTLNAAAAVPEPSTWAMMLLGFGAVGFAMRRRRRVGATLPQIA